MDGRQRSVVLRHGRRHTPLTESLLREVIARLWRSRRFFIIIFLSRTPVCDERHLRASNNHVTRTCRPRQRVLWRQVYIRTYVYVPRCNYFAWYM